jgi:hypothetical protein
MIPTYVLVIVLIAITVLIGVLAVLLIHGTEVFYVLPDHWDFRAAKAAEGNMAEPSRTEESH